MATRRIKMTKEQKKQMFRDQVKKPKKKIANFADQSDIFNSEPKLTSELVDISKSDIRSKSVSNFLLEYKKWYSNCNDATRYKFISDYASKNYASLSFDIEKHIPSDSQNSKVGMYCRLLDSGFNVGDIALFIVRLFFEQRLQTKTVKVESEKISVMERIENQIESVLTDINIAHDSVSSGQTTDFDIVSVLREKNFKPIHAKKIMDRLRAISEEYVQVAKKTPEFVEQYSNMDSKRLKNILIFYRDNLVKLNEFIQIEKSAKPRKPRAKKQKPADQIVKSVKFAQMDKETGIVSLNPSQIVNASKAILYNTKTRVLSWYESEENQTMTVKGCTIQNFAKTSFECKIRKPKETVNAVKGENIRTARKTLQNLKVKKKSPSGRINKDIVIVRVY